MEPGSLVVVKKLPKEHIRKDIDIKWLPVDDETTPHVVRDIWNNPADNKPIVSFSEGVIGHVRTGHEIGIDIEYVREVQPPTDITDMIKNLIDEPVAL